MSADGQPQVRQVPARPGPFRLDPATTALLVIDMQRDFLSPGGWGESIGNDLAATDGVVAATVPVLAAARAAGMLVVHTREGHRPDLADLHPAKQRRTPSGGRIGDRGPLGRYLVRGELGHDIVDALVPEPGEPVVDKPGKGAFHATDLHELLLVNGVSSLVVTGVTTEVCVNTTVREANDRGYECLVLSDCTASYNPEFHRVALEMVCAQGGIFGWVTDSRELLAVLGPADGPGTHAHESAGGES